MIARCRSSCGPLLLAALLLLVSFATGGSPPARADTVQWTPAGSLSDARSGHRATLLDDGRVLVTGGFNDSTTFASVEIYDPTANSWSASDPLNVPRAAHTATRLLDGTVLVAGGADDGTPLAASELFDPLTGAWTEIAPLNTARLQHTASLLTDGTVLVAGGTDAEGAALASAERYDPATGRWTTAADMRVARRFHSATVPRAGVVIVAGGQSGASATDSVEQYDFARDEWVDLASLTTARASHAVAVLANGRMLVVGGVRGFSGNADEASSEVYDPAADAWLPAEPIPYARARHSATTLADGSVLVVGGASTATGPLGDAQRYLPATDTWEMTGALVTARESHTATLLADGDVLVTGGLAGGVQGSAERYPQNDPPIARAPVASLRLGALTGGAVSVAVSWPSALDAEGVVLYQLQRKVNNGAYERVPLASSTSQSATVPLIPGRTHRFRVRATDTLGATGLFAFSAERLLELRQEAATTIRYSGSWPMATDASYSGGAARFATTADAMATISFNGTSVAWVTAKGPGQGRARVQLDGVTIAIIDLYAPTSRTRQLVFARNGLATGPHTLRIIALGTKNGASTGTRVDLDAVVILR